MNEEFVNMIKYTNRKPIFIDLNNLMYRAHFVFTPDKFKTKSGKPNGHFFGLANNIKTMEERGFEIFLCEDCPCTFRRELNEEYKATRNPEENGTAFYKEFDKVRDLFSDLSHVHSLKAEGYEADDVMFSAAKICSNLEKECYIFTTDKDLLQALDKYISIVHKVTLSRR